MSTTVTYNGSTVTQVNNETKTLLTSGKWLTGNIILTDVSDGSGGESTSSNGYILTTVIPEQTFTATTSTDISGTEHKQAQLTYTTHLENGSHYLITYDNSQYIFMCYIYGGNFYALGDIQYFLGGGSSYPFGIVRPTSSQSYYIAIDNNDTGEEHTVKVDKIELIDNLELTEKIITTNGTYSASTDNADGYSSVSVSVPNAISITEVANTTGTTVIVTGTEASGSSATLTTKTITLNGTYSASNDNADGYSQVVVNVPTSGDGSTPSATQHTIHLEFTDETTINIPVYYDDSFISSTITSTTPNQYGQKTIDSALLDGTSWYIRPTETWETLLDNNVDYYPEDDGAEGVYPYCWISSLEDVQIPVDSVWKVTFNNVEYRLVGKNIEQLRTTIIGNPKYGGGQDDNSGVPFYFYNTTYGAWSGGIEGENVSSTQYFKIERLTEISDTGDHIIHFVFTDETTTDIPLHYTDTFTASAITATTPTTYNNKTVETASLDGVVWYTRPQYEVLFDGSVTFQEQSPYNGIYISALSNLYPVSGEVYRITIDNVVYNCVASNDGEDVQIGNPKYNYGIDDGSNVPFALYNGGYGGLNGWTELSASEHTVKIERLTTTQQQGEEE